MTAIRSTAHAAHHTAHPAVGAPTLRKLVTAADLTAAAKDLLARSSGNDVSVATYRTAAAHLAEFSKNVPALKEFLFKSGMKISNHVPTSDFAKHSVKKLSSKHFSKAIYDFAQVPGSVPETPASRANQAAALKDAKVLATALHKTGGDVYSINWNNQDDTNVNILAAVNKKSGELTFVKLFPAI